MLTMYMPIFRRKSAQATRNSLCMMCSRSISNKGKIPESYEEDGTWPSSKQLQSTCLSNHDAGAARPRNVQKQPLIICFLYTYNSMNLAMKRKIWKMKQDIQSRQFAEVEWYVFIDTDTFVEWENMLSLLEHLDPAKQMYIGSPVWLPGLQFAHGGSAYILSQRAMEALNEPGLNDEKELLYSQYGLNTTELCCGDEALAKVLKSKGVKLRGYWPMFNGEVPATLSFGHDLWCEPLISLHHLSGEDMQRLWKWIEGWKRRWKGMVIRSIHLHRYRTL